MPTGTTEDVIIDAAIATRPSIKVDDRGARLSINLPEGVQPHGKEVESVISSVDDSDYPAPSEDEAQTLRKVAGNLQLIAFALCIVEFAERASYYGASTVFSNFVEFPLPKGGNGAGAPPAGTQETAGALGMGLQASSGIVLLFKFLAYVIPILGGWWADVHVGRYYAIVVGVLICGVAHVIQIVGAIPAVLQRGPSNSAPPFIIGLLLLAFGAGIFKPNIAPVVLDQHRHLKPYVKTLKSGERVIVDPEATATRTMLLFYGFVNIGAFFTMATAYTEKYIGYWLSFLLPGILYFILPIVLLAIYKKTYRTPPAGGSDLSNAVKIIKTAISRSGGKIWQKGFWDRARPANLEGSGVTATWTDRNVEDVSRTLSATEVFFYFPLWYLNDGGIGSVQSNQGASMITNGAANETVGNMNPVFIIVSIPILTYIVYPTLDRYKIKFGRINRITLGFALAAISGVIGAIVQWKVYQTSPCGYYASTCDDVSTVSIWWQLPNVGLGAISECFVQVTAYEMAYSRAPPSMRGLLIAIFLFMNALSSALGEILIPVTADPYLIWIWAGPAIVLAAQTVLFWFRFRHLNNDEFMLPDEQIVDPSEPAVLEEGGAGEKELEAKPKTANDSVGPHEPTIKEESESKEDLEKKELEA